MGFKWVTQYDDSGWNAIGRTKIDDETGKQEHYGLSPFDFRGTSEPNAYGGLDHHTVGGYNTCVGHTERHGDADVQTGISPMDVRGRTEHYDDRDVHTDLDGYDADGFSSPGGSAGFHDFLRRSREDATEQGEPEDSEEDSGSRSSAHRRIYYREAMNVDSIHHQDLEDYKSMTDDEIRDRRGVRIQELVDYYYHLDDNPSFPPPAERHSRSHGDVHHEFKESTSFLSRISFPAPRFTDGQVLTGITAAVSVLIVGTIFAISYWPEIRKFLSKSHHEDAAVSMVLPLEQERPEEGHVALTERIQEPARDAANEAPRQPAPPTRPSPTAKDGHRGPRVVPDLGERPSAPARTAPEAESSGRIRHPADYDVVGFDCSKVNNSRLKCDAYLRDGRWKAVTCDRVGTGRIHSCGPFGPAHDRQEFDVRWILRRNVRPQHEPPPRPPRYARRY
ncbi:MAG: hypothetical protein WC350_00025 [Candidatus Micrarchaeia archaeon]|jgi:hypothetical protein